MPVSRLILLIRGARGQCPRCQASDLFQSRFRLRPKCLNCGLPLEQEDGWSLGAFPLNYSITCLGWILPIALAFILGWLTLTPALLLAGFGALLLPFVTYRFSKSLWIGLYYAILPHELGSTPAKKTGCPHDEHPE